MLPDPGANTALSADELPDDVFAEGSVLHVSGYSLMRAGLARRGAEAMDRARDAGMPVSVDPASAALLHRRSRVPATARGRSTCCCPTQDELAALGGDLPGVKEFVVKLGARRRVLERRAQADRRRAPSRSTTSSTPPAPATRSPPAS